MANLDYKQSADGYTLKGGDYVLTRDLEGIAQLADNFVLFGQAEYPLDQDRGTPWNQRILGYKLDDNELKQIITERLLMVPGLTDILSIDITRIDRTRFVSFVANTDQGILDRQNLPLVGGF